ncbi:MAG: hypothetical protein V4649_12600 [Bacteroidota bacterium]
MTKHLIAVLAAATCLAACNKDYNAIPGDTYTLQSAFKELAPKSKIVTLNAATGGTFRGNSGTRFIFPANTFVTASGAPVTGDVQVEVTEYTRKSDMLFSGVLPISGGEPLLSGGEINVTATQNGQALGVAPGATFRANMPMKKPDTAMQLFVGERPNGGAVNWVLAGGGGAGISTAGMDSMSIIASTFTYCNADRFITSPNYQEFKITIEAPGVTLNDDSLIAYTLFDGYNGVWPCFWVDNHIFSENHVPNIPVHFVVAATVKGQLYTGIKGVTPATGANYTVTLAKSTPSALKAQIDAL